MSKFECLEEGQIKRLAIVLGDCGTGTDIDHVLHNRGLSDNSGQSTKWRRLYWVFLDIQYRDKCANRIFDFIKAFLAPARFIGRNEEFENHRGELNQVLAFSGVEYGSDAKFRKCEVAQTIPEAEQRAKTIKAKFKGRPIHPEVVKYCRAELMHDNYFHAVFEATKGLAQRIRDISGVTGDGASLVDKVFFGTQPLIAFNTLQTETEKSEHKGFANLLKGCFGAIRNPRAHEPKILWKGEDDAADYFTLISLLHRKLDDCVPTNLSGLR